MYDCVCMVHHRFLSSSQYIFWWFHMDKDRLECFCVSFLLRLHAGLREVTSYNMLPSKGILKKLFFRYKEHSTADNSGWPE